MVSRNTGARPLVTMSRFSASVDHSDANVATSHAANTAPVHDAVTSFTQPVNEAAPAGSDDLLHDTSDTRRIRNDETCSAESSVTSEEQNELTGETDTPEQTASSDVTSPPLCAVIPVVPPSYESVCAADRNDVTVSFTQPSNRRVCFILF